MLAGVLYVASTVDARPPEVVEMRLTQPQADRDDRALITTSLEVVFSEPVTSDSAVGALRIEPAVDGSVSLSGRTMIFTPDEPLSLETAYAASIEPGVADAAGNEMSELPPPFEFETVGRPSLVEAVPTDGAADVPTDEPIALTFSTLMDTASVEDALRLRPGFAHELRWRERLLEIVPTEPLRAGMPYAVTIGTDAADIAGVRLDESIEVTFRTAEPGLAADVLVPADGVDGIAPATPIAVFFDRPIDPASVSDDVLTIEPELPGTLSVVPHPDDAPADEDSGRILLFTPSGPLPANTTFEVTLEQDVTAVGGGAIASAIGWTFTTGASQGVVSNQITFISDRSGVPNVWAMNPDGTGQRQLSTELGAIVDYAIAPDGSSLVVGDGRRLVYREADGSNRRLLTQEGFVEFDAAYAPNGRHVAFGRAEAESGEGLGLFQWEIGAGEAERIRLPTEVDAPTPSTTAAAPTVLRAPRYSPDGQALAFVDTGGSVGILELPAERLTTVEFAAASTPTWTPDSGALLLVGRRTADGGETPAEAPVEPLAPSLRDDLFRLARSGTTVVRSPFADAVRLIAVGPDGRVGYADGAGALWVAQLGDSGPGERLVEDARVVGGAFSPGEPAMVVVLADGDDVVGSVELLDLDDGSRTLLTSEGSRPRWLP